MNLLKKVMILNALSCVGFGFVFLFFSAAVNNFIGNTLSWLTPVLGVVLIVNGGHLYLASRRKTPICIEILYFVMGDFVWVLASLILIALGIVITSFYGIVLALCIAIMVGIFGILQLLSYRKLCLKV